MNWGICSLLFIEWLAWEGQQERWERERHRSDQTNPLEDTEAGRALDNAVERTSESVHDTEMVVEVDAEDQDEELEPEQREDKARQLHPEAPQRGICLQGRAPLIHLPRRVHFCEYKEVLNFDPRQDPVGKYDLEIVYRKRLGGIEEICPRQQKRRRLYCKNCGSQDGLSCDGDICLP